MRHAAVAAALVIASPALGEPDRPRGYAGLSGSAHLVGFQVTDYRRGYLGRGGGGGVFAGVRVRPSLSLEVTGRATVHAEHFAEARVTNLPLDAVAATTVTVGPRVHWVTGGIVEPYARAGIGYAAIVADFTDCPDCKKVFTSGLGLELGGGLDFSLARWISIGAQASGQLLHFRHDDFERRFRVASEASRNHATIGSLVLDVSAAFHF